VRSMNTIVSYSMRRNGTHGMGMNHRTNIQYAVCSRLNTKNESHYIRIYSASICVCVLNGKPPVRTPRGIYTIHHCTHIHYPYYYSVWTLQHFLLLVLLAGTCITTAQTDIHEQFGHAANHAHKILHKKSKPHFSSNIPNFSFGQSQNVFRA
jgi:hypothetical protein